MKRRALACTFLVLAATGLCPAQPLLSGHAKLTGLVQSSKEGSLEAELGHESRLDAGLDFRLRLQKAVGAWRFEVDYELLSRVGNQVELQRLVEEELGGLFDVQPVELRAEGFDGAFGGIVNRQLREGAVAVRCVVLGLRDAGVVKGLIGE